MSPAFGRAPSGGISPLSINSKSKLSAGLPGTIAGPPSPPFNITSKPRKSNPASVFSAP